MPNNTPPIITPNPIEGKPFFRTSEFSAYQLKVPIFSENANEHGRVEAGYILKLIDVAGCIPAKRHLGPTLDPVTASLDRMDFYASVQPWDICVLDAKMTRVWKTSMETRVVVTAWDFRTSEIRLIATAYMVTVGVKNRGNSKISANEMPLLPTITPEDKLLQHSADVRKQYRTFELARTRFIALVDEEDEPTITEALMTFREGNGLGELVFGGVILSHIYNTALKAATKQVGNNHVVCARQDRMDFLQPAHIGETLRVKAQMTKTWHSSMEIQVECEAVSLNGESRMVATTYFVFVRLDADTAKPIPVQPWVAKTPRQQEREQMAIARRRLREDEAAHFGNSL
jgi:acyl-CoA hydrolase